MFTLRAPDTDRLSRFLADQRSAPTTYEDEGATLRGDRPEGYHHDHASIEVGTGDVAWTRAKDGIDQWRAAAAAGISNEPPEAPITVGTTVAIVTRLGPLTMLAACRIVAVVNEPDRYGFAYGTLPAHPEEGEELFLVTRGGDDTVRFEITAFSRAHDLLTRLGAPVARRVQRQTTKRYLEGMRDWVR